MGKQIFIIDLLHSAAESLRLFFPAGLVGLGPETGLVPQTVLLLSSSVRPLHHRGLSVGVLRVQQVAMHAVHTVCIAAAVDVKVYPQLAHVAAAHATPQQDCGSQKATVLLS